MTTNLYQEDTEWLKVPYGELARLNYKKDQEIESDPQVDLYNGALGIIIQKNVAGP